MGFWGTYIVARADQPLPELPALRQSAESVVWHGRGPGGWQAVQVYCGPDGYESRELPARWEATLTALMEQAGHPVLAAVIRDSDGAQLIGYSPVAGRWGGWLMLDRIIGHIIPDAWPMIVAWDDETGPLEFESDDDEDYQRRHQAALDRMHAVGPPAPGSAERVVLLAAVGPPLSIAAPSRWTMPMRLSVLGLLALSVQKSVPFTLSYANHID